MIAGDEGWGESATAGGGGMGRGGGGDRVNGEVGWMIQNGLQVNRSTSFEHRCLNV